LSVKFFISSPYRGDQKIQLKLIERFGYSADSRDEMQPL
jgi:hypothetical protein